MTEQLWNVKYHSEKLKQVCEYTVIAPTKQDAWVLAGEWIRIFNDGHRCDYKIYSCEPVEEAKEAPHIYSMKRGK